MQTKLIEQLVLYCSSRNYSQVSPSIINLTQKPYSLVQCEQCGFVYIDSAEIRVDQHLWKDGLHLSESGKVKLANDFINAINSYL